jgi:hypothetical protein
MNERNMDKGDAVPAVSDAVTPAELKRTLPVTGINRPLNIPRRRVGTNTPPCEHEFDRIHSSDGGRNGS